MGRGHHGPESARREVLYFLSRQFLRQLISPEAPHALTSLSKSDFVELAMTRWNTKQVQAAFYEMADKLVEHV
jgi:hypothetical protein